MKVRIHRAAETEADALLRLYEEFHNHYVARIPDRFRVVEGHTAESRRLLLGTIASTDAVIFTAEVDDEPVGLAEAHLRTQERTQALRARTYVHLQSLMVIEHYRGSGIGRQLLNAVHHWARERGAGEVETDIWELEDGPFEFYVSNGYHTLRRTLTRQLNNE